MVQSGSWVSEEPTSAGLGLCVAPGFNSVCLRDGITR